MEINFNLTAESAAMQTAFSEESLALKLKPVPHFPVSVETKEFFPVDAGI